jgi:hypothetical protein
MEINNWAKLVKSGLIRSNVENEESDLIILGHYGGFSTYKQDAWSGYAMKISDFIAQVSGITNILGGPGILITGLGPIKTVSLDGTSGGGTDFNVQPNGNIVVSKNGNPLAGNLITIENLDTLDIGVISVPSGLNWQDQWNTLTTYNQDDVVWFEDVDGTYYTYWAYQGPIAAGTPLPVAGQASANGWARLGLEGPMGNPGYSTGIMKIYQWSTTAPTVFPIDQSAYTWADGAFTDPSDIGLWSQTIPTNPLPGETLWELTQQYTAYPIGTTENITWASISPKAIAYFGDAGTDGKSVLSGSGAPNNSLGEDGDFYIDIDSAEYTMYGPKVLGNWLTNPTKNLKGDAGNNGSITYSGTGFPLDSLGLTGDYYIQTDSPNYTMFGPKLQDNDWTGAGSIDLKGPQGPTGGAVINIGASISSTPYTITATDATSLIKLNTTLNNIVVQVPDNLTTMTNGSQVMFVWDQRDGGLVYTASFIGTGLTTIKSANDMKYLRTQYSAATLIKISNTEYYLVGDIAPY